MVPASGNPQLPPRAIDDVSETSVDRDVHLINRIRGNDESALEALIVAYAGWLVEIATPMLGSSDLAQDAVQDVFVRLWEIRASLAIHGRVAGYLYRAVRNRARDLMQRERVQHSLPDRARRESFDSEPQVSNAGEANIADGEFHEALDVALQDLQPRTREVFLLRFQAEMSYAEIAKSMGIGVPTVRLQMSRAIKGLARHMARWARFGEIRPDSQPAERTSRELV